MSISYLPEDDPHINEDLILRKEFELFKISAAQKEFERKYAKDAEEKNIIPQFLFKHEIGYLELRSYQLFVRNYINPNTPYSRLLIKFDTGLGKTITAISIALNFINFYRKQEEVEGDSLGSVFVLGFTKKIFQDELIKYPQLGFVSKEEMETLNVLKKRAMTGEAGEEYKNMLAQIKRRFSNRKGNGFFKFIGYKELFNHLFLQNKRKEEEIYLPNLSEEELQDHIQKGNIIVNEDLIGSFRNSLVICDEVHNIYNTTDKNNWGVAIQTILNNDPSTRAIFLSATPINNSPLEVIDILNLLLPRQLYPQLKKQDYFSKGELLPNKESELKLFFNGRVSFLRDRLTKKLATRSFEGEKIKGIEFLKFIRCPMGEFQQKTYEEDSENPDIALPRPQESIAINPFKMPGVSLPKDIRHVYANIPQQFKEKYGIKYNKDDYPEGSIFREKLGVVSSKYKKMIETVINIIKNKRGKIFIYHNYIHVSGTMLIAEILRQNNVISVDENSTDQTLCAICGLARKSHSTEELDGLLHQMKKGKHFYEPARFILVHSEIDKRTNNLNLDKFNEPNNIRGNKIMIVVGSRIIKESHSLNSVRNILVMSRPESISALIQIMGRAIRLNSHRLLPSEERHVHIMLFVTSFNNSTKLTSEEEKYGEKIRSFKVIQHIERIMHETAIDAYFNYEMIWGDKKTEELDILPYSVKHKTVHRMHIDTFNAYYAKFTVNYVMYIIKRLFLEISPVWNYKDLLTAVKMPPFSIEINADQITESIFGIALGKLLYNEDKHYEEIHLEDRLSTIESLQNPEDKLIVKNETVYAFTRNGEIYYIAPLIHREIYKSQEIPFRDISGEINKQYNIKDYLQFSENGDYQTKRRKFIEKWKSVPFTRLEDAINDFGVNFHKTFVEEVIEYVFKLWTDPKQNKEENHDFYMHILYYYDMQKFILWADTLNEELLKEYRRYIVEKKLQFSDLSSSVREEIESFSPHFSKKSAETMSITENNLFITTLNHSSNSGEEELQIYNKHAQELNKLFEGNYKVGKIKKVSASYLPVGHLLSAPRFYIPSRGWFDKSFSTKTTKENNIIVGFDQRTSNGLKIQFKLRKPLDQTMNEDKRLIERGMACNSKSREYLISVAKKLGIKPADSIIDLCKKIRIYLIFKEYQERIKNTGIRYFYFIYET